MKKVLFIIQTLGFGGAERSLVNLLYELSGDKYRIDLLLFRKEGAFISQLPPWVNVLEIPEELRLLYSPLRRAGRLRPTKLFGTLCSLPFGSTRKARAAFRWKHFYKKKIGLIPGHYDTAVAYSGAEVMYLLGDCVSADRKLVWIHNDYIASGYSRKDDLPYFADMDAMVSVSEGCVNILGDCFPRFAHKIHCIENISSSGLIRKLAEAFEPPEYAGEDPVLLSVGRLSPQKGFDMAVSAAAWLKKRNYRFKWYIIGEGELRPELEKKIAAERVGDRFILLGPRSNPYPYIKNADLLVQSSRFEGKSVVLDEAKILAVPILATDYPTVRDQIDEGVEGVIAPMDPMGIATGIGALLVDRDKLQRLRRFLSERNYDNREEAAKYMDLLD